VLVFILQLCKYIVVTRLANYVTVGEYDDEAEGDESASGSTEVEALPLDDTWAGASQTVLKRKKSGTGTGSNGSLRRTASGSNVRAAGAAGAAHSSKRSATAAC